RCARFMEVQCARAERIFAESAPLESLVAREAVPTLAAMSAIYRGILRRIARDPRRALERRVRLSALEKSLIALRARLGLLGGAR
ncbi:MAG: squalene/phytoene synthase family protein, partial [Planctomycetota bacterium]